MARMAVVVNSVVSGMLVFVQIFRAQVLMIVAVFVNMIMSVLMRVLVSVLLIAVFVFMLMSMGVCMGVLVLVLVAVHGKFSFPRAGSPASRPLRTILTQHAWIVNHVIYLIIICHDVNNSRRNGRRWWHEPQQEDCLPSSRQGRQSPAREVSLTPCGTE